MTKGHVVGFGTTHYDFHSNVCVLREIFIDIFSPRKCLRSGNPKEFNKRDTICAGIDAGGIDACQVRRK